MADTPNVQKPGTGTASPTPSAAPQQGASTAPGPNQQSNKDVRPVTTQGGTTVLSGPIPPGADAGFIPVPTGELVAAGSPGGPFNIRGANFHQQGNVFVGGKQVTVTSWDHNRIKGVLPSDVDMKAEILVQPGAGQPQRGVFGKKAQPISVTVQLDPAAVGRAVADAQK